MTNTNHPRFAYILVNLAVFIWSTNFILGRALSTQVGPFTIAFGRVSVASIVILILFLRYRPNLQPIRSQWLLFFLLGFTGIFGHSLLAYSGLKYTTATNASVINGAMPLVISSMAHLFLKERATGLFNLGLVISVAGIVVIVSNGSAEVLLNFRFNGGDILILLSLISWGFYSILVRIASRTFSALIISGVSLICGLPLLFLAALVEWQTTTPHLTWQILLALLYIGTFPAFVALVMWNEGVMRLGAAKAAAFYNMLTLFGMVLGILVLGENLGLPQIIGGGLVISGSLLGAWQDIWQRAPKTI